MRISVVNLTSDSSDAENEGRSVTNPTTTKLYTCDKSSQTCFCENEQFVAEQRVPLFKIIFKDESTSRIYRKKLEDIAKSLVAAKLDECIESNSSDLVLEIYESSEDFNTTITSDSTGMQIPVIDYYNSNSTFYFSYNKEMKAEPIVVDEVKSQNIVFSINSFDQINQSVDTSGILAWNAQPQEVQQSIVQSEFSSSVNFNVKKRKSLEDSDLSSSKKKIKVEYEPEYVSQFHNETRTLTTPDNNALGTSYYDFVWYNSSNAQSTAIETSRTQYYDPVWYNSSNAQSTATESMLKEKPKDSFSQVQDMNSLLRNKKIIATYTYRILKIGSCDYAKKRTFTISEDGIQLCASHFNEMSTIVKLNIAIANILKIEARFSKILPALFIYTNKNAAIIIKEALGINKNYTAFFNPESSDDTCNKIIILPDNMPECCGVLKNMVKVGLIIKLDKESADNILLNSFSKILKQKPQIKQLSSNLFLNITSHSIRIGTYKCSQMKFNVRISMNGFQFHMPKVGDGEIFKKITIGFAEIDKLYFSLQKISAFFLHVNSLCAQRIRSLIEISETDKSEVYFDPDSETIAEQRLVIVFNNIKPSQQETLMNLLSYTQSAEITLQKIIHEMLYNHM